MGKIRIPRFVLIVSAGYFCLMILLYFIIGPGRHQGDVESLMEEPSSRVSNAHDETEEEGLVDGEGSADRQENKEIAERVPASEMTEAEAVNEIMKSFRTYYEDGSVSSEWNFENGILEGSVWIMHENKEVLAELPFRNGLLEGRVRLYDETGAPWGNIEYAKGKRNGRSEFYYPGMKPWIEAEYLDGKLQRVEKLYSQDGEETPFPPLSLSSQGASPTGSFKSFSSSGRIKSEVVEGKTILRTYYDNGNPSSEWPLEDGQMQGSVKLYSESGELMSETVYDKGQHSGSLTVYYPGGEEQLFLNYQNDMLKGDARLLYPSGHHWITVTFGESSGPEAFHAYSVNGAEWSEVQPALSAEASPV